MKYIEKVAVDYFIANVPTFLIAEMIPNYLAIAVNTFFKFFFCHDTKLLKIVQIYNVKTTDCSVRREILPSPPAASTLLEMMRLAPSSTNSQPWRAFVSGNLVHFYYKPKSSVSVLDCGIGMCHFYEAEKYQSQAGEFFKSSDFPQPPENWKYIYSYKRINESADKIKLKPE